MPLILSVRGFTPKIGEDCFIAPNATLIGDISIGNKSSIWFQTVIRGDVNEIRIGNEVNIQDGAIIHGTFEKSGTFIGNQVSIGHNAVVHGCYLHDRVLIGMNAVILDKAEIKSHVLVAAGSVVLENSVLESGFIYAGAPARKVKALTEEQIQFFIERTAKNYQLYASWYAKDQSLEE
ncbi:MAG: gamma carbonic anhydrase family protein [Bacteroidota bacterium]|nr:gamma carbonic anhydrase family protein [Bacteroidota bacterium]